MKKMIYAGAVLCAMALTTGCSNEELMENGKDSAFSLKATTDTDTRTSVNEQYNVLWNAGDLCVWRWRKRYADTDIG